jgi:hypothetical protein
MQIFLPRPFCRCFHLRNAFPLFYYEENYNFLTITREVISNVAPTGSDVMKKVQNTRLKFE